MAANGDERLPEKFGSFHKTLPHDPATGLVAPDAYMEFARIAESRTLDFEQVERGGGPDTARLVSPLASRSHEHCGPHPEDMDMLPAPGVQSCSTAAEMVELYWMALLRDLEFCKWPEQKKGSDFAQAVTEVREAYSCALREDASLGRLRLGLDLPRGEDAGLRIDAQTLFRSGLPDEDHGPLVSQFFLHPVTFGTQEIDQRQVPYLPNVDFLTNWDDWLRAQNEGRDYHGNDYPRANTQPAGDFQLSERRYICSMRDLARFVHKDALHQAYFNAALLLLDWGAPRDPNDPYRRMLPRQGGFATLGGPHLLTLVSEVASRALKVVWRQKWAVHRRLRPEAYGGLLESQRRNRIDFGLAKCGADCTLPGPGLLKRVARHNRSQRGAEASYLLPMAFSSGSPVHPAYGAGHATVAGACVTVLKAWFDEDARFQDVAPRSRILAGCCSGKAAYEGSDRTRMTIGGELNKLASNVAMGRSMGGVHWRSDNTRSLRLGEQIATVMLRRQARDYAEPGYAVGYRNFDGRLVSIDGAGRVVVDGDPGLQSFYMQDKFAPPT